MNRKQTHKNDYSYYGIFNDSFPPILDGVTLTVENYVYWLSQNGLSPLVVTPWNPISVKMPYEVVRFFSLPIHNRHPYRYGYPKLDPFIWRRLRKTNFKILHSHCPFSSGRLAVYVKKKQNVPLIGTFHSKYKMDLQHSFKHMPYCVPIIMKRILDFYNACDEVWIPQAAVEDTVREYGYKGKLTVVENGMDFTSMIDGDLISFKDNQRRKIGIGNDDLSLLFVGQHIFEKGTDIIIEALSLIKDGIPFRMNFIGTGYALNELKELAKIRGISDRVNFHGVLEDRKQLASYYAASDLFLFPSKYDNAPLVVREAAAMGTPSIMVAGSTASEVIRDGINGFLSEATPIAYAEILRKLSKDRDNIRSVGRNASETLVRSWQNVVEEVIDRYNVILKNFKR